MAYDVNSSRCVVLPGTFGGWAGVTVEAWTLPLAPAPPGGDGFQAVVSSSSPGAFLHMQMHENPIEPPTGLGTAQAVYAGGGTPGNRLVSVAPSFVGQWRHHSLAGASGNVKGALDGATLPTGDFTAWGGNPVNTGDATIGRGNAGIRHFQGRLARVAIFNYRLSDATIAAHANAGNAATYDALVMAAGPYGFWKLDEVLGTVAVDSSGNGRHGTYIGSPLLGQPGPYSGTRAVQLVLSLGAEATGIRPPLRQRQNRVLSPRMRQRVR